MGARLLVAAGVSAVVIVGFPRKMTSRGIAAACVFLVALAVGAHHVLAAPEHSGQVTFGGLPVPGATVTATSGERRLVTVTDEQGMFRFADVGDGVWKIR